MAPSVPGTGYDLNSRDLEVRCVSAYVANPDSGQAREDIGALLMEYRTTIFAIVLSHTKNEDDAYDLTQRVLLRALRKLPTLRDPRCLPGWLRSLAHREGVSFMRTGRDLPLVDDAADIFPGREPPVGEPQEVREEIAAMLIALKTMKPLDREALEAFYLQGMSIDQISVAFGVPDGTVKRRLHVARLRLRAIMEGEEGDFTSSEMAA
jgi:RNA polymerase sigma-70 factor (ECF subfamily)